MKWRGASSEIGVTPNGSSSAAAPMLRRRCHRPEDQRLDISDWNPACSGRSGKEA
ncbi:MAG: hypothetical protein LUO85_00090 [Methanomassiliicoccales archaeon]|nr:hypothetical protein [Methanomassiliicoccales archaeon]